MHSDWKHVGDYVRRDVPCLWPVMGVDVYLLTKWPLVFKLYINVVHQSRQSYQGERSRVSRPGRLWDIHIQVRGKRCMMVLYYRWFIYSASQFLHPVPQYGPLRLCFLRCWPIRWCSRPSARFRFSFILEFIPIASDRIQMRQEPRQGNMKHSSNSSILSHLSGGF